MAKSTEEIEKFIELRARGMSYDRIAEETGVSKPTLLKWSKDYGEEIGHAQYFELQNLLAQYGVMRKSRVEAMSQLLSSALIELKQRANSESLSRLSTDKLVSLALLLEQRIEKEAEGKKIDLSPLGKYQWGNFAEVD